MKRKRTYVVVVEAYDDNAETAILERIVKTIIKGRIKTKHTEIAVNTLADAIKDVGLDIVSVGHKTITTLNNRVSFNTYNDYIAENC